MKILHTSDWHLGHRLHEQSQHEEQSLFLNGLKNYIAESNIDILLVSGDIFDTGAPSTQSLKLYYDFLINLRTTACKHIVITGGNHDAPGTLNAPKELLQALSIHVTGKATENVGEEVFKLSVDDEEVIIAAVPYLRDQDIRKATAGESFEQVEYRYKQALIRHYAEVAAHCLELKNDMTPVIAMGHLFAVGGTTSESELSIYVGNLGDIGAGDFPEIFDYVALGHLHRPQKVGGSDHIRYCGSPYPLSFGETGYNKQIIVIETEKGKVKKTEEVPLPEYRKLIRVKGTPEECIIRLRQIGEEEHSPVPWAEVVLVRHPDTSVAFGEMNKAVEGLNIEVLKVTLDTERKMQGLEKLIENSKHVRELSPTEVFKMKCKEQDFDLENNPDIFDAFHEALQIAREGQQ